MKVLILGVTGMLGNTMFRYLSQYPELDVYATARSERATGFFEEKLRPRILAGVNVENQDTLIQTYSKVRPDVVINCVGLIKQLAECNDPLVAIPINTLLPHRLSALCDITKSRLIHISTDCVFAGTKGHYLESDAPDAYDLYGRSKLLGEVDAPHAITLRTSLIGHELSGHYSLVNWFLSQQGQAKGYTQAIFSGLPTVELCRVVREHVFPHPELHGLYHVAASAINKHDLLQLIASAYRKQIEIIPDDKVKIDRSLNADRFNNATGYQAPDWHELIRRMAQFQ